MENQPQTDPALVNIMEIIRVKFEPVTDESEADTLITTQELIRNIESHTGAKVDPHLLYRQLTDLGYKQSSDSEINFHWLFKLK